MADEKQDLLAAIFEPSLSLDRRQSTGNVTARAMSLWEHMAKLLEEIAANTRGFRPQAGGRRSSSAAVEAAQAAPIAREQRTPPGRGHRQADQRPSRVPTTTDVPQERTRTAHVATARPQRETPPASKITLTIAEPRQKRQPSERRSAIASARPRDEKGRFIRADAVNATNANTATAQPTALAQSTPANTSEATAQQTNAAREARENAERTGKIVGDAVASKLDKHDASPSLWDKGKAYVSKHRDVQDMLGYALAGPLWGAYRDIEDLLPKRFQTSQGRRKSDRDAQGHFLPGRLQNRQQTQDAASTQASRHSILPQGWSKFLSQVGQSFASPGTQNTALPQEQRTQERQQQAQLDVATNALRLDEQEARAEDKRHRELIRTLKGLAPGQGGLLDGLLGDKGKSSGGIDIPDIGRNRPGAGTASPAGRRGWLGGLRNVGRGLGGLARGAGSALLGASGLGELASGAAGIGEMASSALGLGGKAAAGGLLRALPVIGQIATAGMTAYEAYQGWNDDSLHRRAFGLNVGEEATTGQKASAAAAGILDLGGLTSGVAGLLGFDINQASMAKGIHDLGSGIANFFGFGEEEKPAEQAQAAQAATQPTQITPTSPTAQATEQPQARQTSPAETSTTRLTAARPTPGDTPKTESRPFLTLADLDRPKPVSPAEDETSDTAQTARQAAQTTIQPLIQPSSQPTAGQAATASVPVSASATSPAATVPVVATPLLQPTAQPATLQTPPHTAAQPTAANVEAVAETTAASTSKELVHTLLQATPLAPVGSLLGGFASWTGAGKSRNSPSSEAEKDTAKPVTETSIKDVFSKLLQKTFSPLAAVGSFFGKLFGGDDEKAAEAAQNAQGTVPGIPNPLLQATTTPSRTGGGSTQLERQLAVQDAQKAQRSSENTQTTLSDNIVTLTETIQTQNKLLELWLTQLQEGGAADKGRSPTKCSRRTKHVKAWSSAWPKPGTAVWRAATRASGISCKRTAIPKRASSWSVNRPAVTYRARAAKAS